VKIDQLFADEALHAARGSIHDAKKIIEKVGFFSELIAAIAPNIAPYAYQQDIADDYKTRMTAWEKPRGVGGSWTFSLTDVGKRLAMPRSGGIHMSLNMEDAAQKISYAKEIWQALDDEIPVPQITVDNKTELGFENGSTIQAVFNPRGKHGKDIYWDEMAHHGQARFLMRSVMPAILRKNVQLRCGSTVNTGATLFSEIMRGHGGKYQSWRRIRTYWWECPEHCSNVTTAALEAPTMSTEERVAKYGSPVLKDFFDSMLIEDFQCEFELVELGDDDAWLPWDMILASTPAGADYVPNLTPEEFTRYMDDHPNARVFGGYDVGRVKDTGEFSGLFDDPLFKGEIAFERMTKTFRARSFQEQQDFLTWYLSHPRTFLAIDRGGLGMQLAEYLVTRFGAARVTAVDFGSKLVAPFEYRKDEADAKSVLATTLKKGMISDLVRWQVDVAKNYQMHSVRRHVTESLHAGFRVDTSDGEGQQKKHHADVFWARALAFWKWRSVDMRRMRFAAVG